jgi:hypothetical protein
MLLFHQKGPFLDSALTLLSTTCVHDHCNDCRLLLEHHQSGHQQYRKRLLVLLIVLKQRCIDYSKSVILKLKSLQRYRYT